MYYVQTFKKKKYSPVSYEETLLTHHVMLANEKEGLGRIIAIQRPLC